jgi:ATP-binding cassette subfamily B multidrug efflux pump
MLKFFENLVSAFPDAEPDQPPAGLGAFIRHYTRGMEWPLLAMALCTASLAVLEVMLFGFLGQLVDWLVDKNPDTLLSEEGSTLLLMAAVLLLVMPLLALLHTLITHQTLLGNYPMAIRWAAHRYLLKQSVSFFQNDFAGRIATKVMQTSLSIREAVMKLLDVFVYVLVYFTSMLIMIWQANTWLMLPMLVWLIVYILVQTYFVPRLKRVSAEQADARSLMTGRIVDSYTNISTVKLFSHSKREAQYAKNGMQEFLQTVYRQMRLSSGITLCIELLNYLLIFAIATLSIALWMHQSISVGAIAIAISLALRLNGMSHWIMWEVSALFEHLGTTVDGASTLAQPRDILDKTSAQPLTVEKGSIEFQSVGFNYGKSERVLQNLDLSIGPGEKVGLVGRSGAGKSTLVNLLLRFHDVEAGKILIDGQDIREVTQDSVRASIGVVTQDTSLLHRTVRENILYGNANATDDAMIDAAKRAEAHEFIMQLSDPKGGRGYDAQVGERGVKLSGGQRQRIAIARVLLKDASILVLDEATSALDSEVEAAIQASLYSLMQGKTVIAIAHRLSTIAAMDRLIIMDEGQIVEQGTHDSLLAENGLYASLWARQTRGFLVLDNDTGDNP